MHSNKRFRPELNHSHGHHGNGNGNGYGSASTPQAYSQGLPSQVRSDSDQTSGSDPGSGSMSRSVSDFSLALSGPPRPMGPGGGPGLQGYGTPGSYPGPELTNQHMMPPHDGSMQGGHMHPQQAGVVPFQENAAASNRGMPLQQQQQLNSAFLLPNGHGHGLGHGHGQVHGHMHPNQQYQQMNACLQPAPSPLGNPGMPNGQLSNAMVGHSHPGHAGIPPHPHGMPMTSAPGGMTPPNGFQTPTNGLIPGPQGGHLTPQAMQNGSLPPAQMGPGPPSGVKWETPTPPHSGGAKGGPSSGTGNGSSGAGERGGGGSAGNLGGGNKASSNGGGLKSNGNSSSGNLSGSGGGGGGARGGGGNANASSNSGGGNSGTTNANSSANGSSNSNGAAAGPGSGAPPPSAALLEPPCAACKSLRRKCTRDCIFLPYFPRDDPDKFARVHKVFGASNVAKMLQVSAVNIHFSTAVEYCTGPYCPLQAENTRACATGVLSLGNKPQNHRCGPPLFPSAFLYSSIIPFFFSSCFLFFLLAVLHALLMGNAM